MKKPRVSVCIVTYNHEWYIRQCIMSVIAQADDVPLEILVGDDLSNDGTEKIVREIADRFPQLIRFFRHKARLGPAGNYQHLIREARGTYIAHLDGDDYWLPGKLARQVIKLDSSEVCPAVYSNAICINSSGELLGLFNSKLNESFSRVALISGGNFLNHSSLLYRTELRGEILEWSPDFIDYRIHLHLASYGDIGYINSPYVAYRVNSSGSMLANQNDHVRDLYWEATRATLIRLNDRQVVINASADLLSGAFFRAREIKDYSFFFRWWQLVNRNFQCNKWHLAARVVAITLRRRFRSLLNKLCGKLAGIPIRVFHQR